MIHTIEMINKSPLLPNVTLGYEIYDTCADPTTAIKTVMRLMDDKSDSAENCIPLKCRYTNYNSTVKAVIGESHSEISIVIAHLLSVPLIPQISYESTSEILSQKTRFPSFLRTIPSDTYQSKAIAELALHLNWISVGAIGSDDEYGKYGVESFLDHAQELGLCVPFKEIVPAYMFREESSNHQKKIAEVIKDSSAEAIVLFTKPENVERIIQEAIKHNLTKTWIASDAWAISTKIAQIKGIETVGKILGFTCRRQTVPGFKNYIHNLLANDPSDNNFLRQYKEYYPPCSKKTEPNIQNSLTNTNNKTVNVSQCTDDNFLIQEIDRDIFFGVYLAINAITDANCSKKCNPGYEWKETNLKCCKECIPCSEGSFSAGGSQAECKRCDKMEHSTAGSEKCIPKNTVYLKWDDSFVIVLVFFEVAGFITTLIAAVIFTVYFNTPVVKSAGGYLCYIMFVSLLASFSSICTFIAKPTTTLCKISYPLFAISFTLCVSCILANLFQIFVGFTFEKSINEKLQRFNNPLFIVTVCTGLQVIFCALWLVLSPPYVYNNEETFPIYILIECKLGSTAAIWGVIGYVALLAAICFIFAFKGRHLPDLYKNAKYISLSMLVFFVVWAIFIPVHLTVSGMYVPAAEGFASLLSSYSILCCHFCPKCYIILFKKEQNNEKAIVDNIRNHFEKKGKSAITSRN
ncbi:UNVERIFIED_CONTAM: hypothetical protein FKN15_062028 [Acipenser sinensis]